MTQEQELALGSQIPGGRVDNAKCCRCAVRFVNGPSVDFDGCSFKTHLLSLAFDCFCIGFNVKYNGFTL